MFSLRKNNWRAYNFTTLTTVVEVGYHDPQLVCFAHERRVRVVSIANYPTNQLSNSSARSQWVQDKLKFTLTQHLDGINFDFEDAISSTRIDLKDGLSKLVEETYRVFKKADPRLQITFDVAWSPDCIDQRCYDYFRIASSTDFLFVMSYDERSQIYDECIAWANSALNTTIHGVERYSKIGIPIEKLVLGVPWYGYDYPCIKYEVETRKCWIKKVPFRGVNCSDASGSQRNIEDIAAFSKNYTVHWEKIAESPYFTYFNNAKKIYHQIWFDNVDSLKIKYKYAIIRRLRGLGAWNADAVGKDQTKKMWSALPCYKCNEMRSDNSIVAYQLQNK
ncbi:unnamed protein product [Dimorphilus gyrociliatus]|uniref:Di-N-acetylchitobiase n=1 Tax=Dimorphilus gyrociliatus TaxID=2664684 RepID=A0A7I8W3B1_9ANNE|nr:unnamed protein product [Dimorphilus gyrociliatus]